MKTITRILKACAKIAKYELRNDPLKRKLQKRAMETAMRQAGVA